MSSEEILKGDHSIFNRCAVPYPRGAIWFAGKDGVNIKCDHSNESYLAVLSCVDYHADKVVPILESVDEIHVVPMII